MYRNIPKVRWAIVIAVLAVMLLAQSSMMNAITSTAPDKALAFIKDIIQLDMQKYTANLTTYTTDYPPELAGVRREFVGYNLQAAESNLTAFCQFNNNTLTACSISTTAGKFLYAQPFATIVDTAKNIIEKYQNFAENPNVKEMATMLNTIEENKNATNVVGNLKLEVTSDSYHTSFDWKYTFNGVDYNAVSIIFEERGSIFFSDYQSLYKIGKTDVNISKEKAIEAAMKYIETYSYTGIVNTNSSEVEVEISGFNITKGLTEATVATNFKEPLTLYPCWNIKLFLDQKQPYQNYTYPSGVYALLVRVWADSGEVFSCTPLAVGGALPTQDFTAPETESVPETGTSPVTYLAAITAITTVITITMLVHRKRNK